MALGELNHAFDLMLQGEVKRSVVVYEYVGGRRRAARPGAPAREAWGVWGAISGPPT